MFCGKGVWKTIPEIVAMMVKEKYRYRVTAVMISYEEKGKEV